MSYAFDGAGDTLTGAFGATYQFPLTIACWVKVTAHPLAGDFIMVVGKNAASSNDSFDIRTDSTDDQWAARATDSAAASTQVTSAATNIDATWAPIVAVYASATDRRIYVGSYANSAQSTQSRTVVDIGYVRLGESLTGAGDFTGKIAEAAFWDKALSQAEIESFIAGTVPSSIAASDLIGYWPLNASNATQSNLGIDSAGDLTVTGATYDADHPTIFSLVKKLKVLVESTAQSDGSIVGTVFDPPTTEPIHGAHIGQFTGAAFEGTLEGGLAVLKVPVSEFGGEGLTTLDTPVVLLRNATDSTSIVTAEVIEE